MPKDFTLHCSEQHPGNKTINVLSINWRSILGGKVLNKWPIIVAVFCYPIRWADKHTKTKPFANRE